MCGEEKSKKDFYVRKETRDGLRSECKNCHNKKSYIRGKQWRIDHKEEYREYRRMNNQRPEVKLKNSASKFKQRMKKIYGINILEYNRMLEEQFNGWKTCGRPVHTINKRLSVDHNHKTGNVRGLLCGQCNSILGLCNDNIAILYSLIDYLKEDEKKYTMSEGKYNIEKLYQFKTL